MNIPWQKLVDQIYIGLAWFTPIVAVLAMYFAHRAYVLAQRNNAVLESVWTLLKAVRAAQEVGAPSAQRPSEDKRPELPRI